MRRYIGVTGGLFALIVIAHIWRMIVEVGFGNVSYLGLTVVSAALAGWALTLLRRSASQA